MDQTTISAADERGIGYVFFLIFSHPVNLNTINN
jgi:hypothetical protein